MSDIFANVIVELINMIIRNGWRSLSSVIGAFMAVVCFFVASYAWMAFGIALLLTGTVALLLKRSG